MKILIILQGIYHKSHYHDKNYIFSEVFEYIYYNFYDSLALSSMGKMFNEILDITIVYPDGTVSFWDLLCGRFDRVIVDIKKIEIEDWMLVNDYHKSNQNKEKFHQWLNQLWQEKDNKISEIKHGFL